MDNECDRAPIEIPRSPNRDVNSRHLPVMRHHFEKWYYELTRHKTSGQSIVTGTYAAAEIASVDRYLALPRVCCRDREIAPTERF